MADIYCRLKVVFQDRCGKFFTDNMSLKEILEKEGINQVYYFDVYALQLYWGLNIEFLYLSYFAFHYLLLFLNILCYFVFISKSQGQIFICKIHDYFYLDFNSVKNLKNQFYFAVLMASLFLPKYKCYLNESFLSKVSIKSNGNLTSVVELLILSLILNKLFK